MASERTPLRTWRLAVNICMTAVLLCLMPYSRMGEANHEILGVALFALFVVHHVLNRKWLGALTKGRYGAFRIAQTALVVLLTCSVVATITSGIIISNHLFIALTGGIDYGIYEAAKGVHMVSAHLNYVLMSLHLGLHWGTIIAAVRRGKEKYPTAARWVIRALVAGLAVYGIYAFIKRHIGEYLVLRAHFLLLDANEPLILFFFDYLAIVALFVLVGYVAAKLLKRADRGASPDGQRMQALFGILPSTVTVEEARDIRSKK